MQLIKNVMTYTSACTSINLRTTGAQSPTKTHQKITYGREYTDAQGADSYEAWKRTKHNNEPNSQKREYIPQDPAQHFSHRQRESKFPSSLRFLFSLSLF